MAPYIFENPLMCITVCCAGACRAYHFDFYASSMRHQAVQKKQQACYSHNLARSEWGVSNAGSSIKKRKIPMNSWDDTPLSHKCWQDLRRRHRCSATGDRSQGQQRSCTDGLQTPHTARTTNTLTSASCADLFIFFFLWHKFHLCSTNTRFRYKVVQNVSCHWTKHTAA